MDHFFPLPSIWFLISFNCFNTQSKDAFNLDSLNIPSDHLPYFLNIHPHLKGSCMNGTNPCEPIHPDLCWGYENDCKEANRYFRPVPCEGDSKGWTQNKKDQERQFFLHGDFGYLWKRLQEMVPICKALNRDDSSLTCSQYTRYCHGRHLYLDLRKLLASPNRRGERYRDDLFLSGQIGGSCKFNQPLLQSNSNHKSSLQSWYAELENFTPLKFKPSKSKKCEATIQKPTFIIKIDAVVNMFHHFCDFINLYMSQHLNGTFNMDINILIWDTSALPINDPFAFMWNAFTKNPLLSLSDYHGKRLCISDFVMGLLPRMRFGHFYNMPLMPGCSGTGLYKAFSHHIIHRLSIPQNGPSKTVRITILERRTKHRNIMNQGELVKILKQDKDISVQVEYFNFQVSFEQQLTIIHNTDILVGMHGAGLTHLLFLPDWAVVFELYSCEDEDCYSNLARLRGVKYLTWEKMELLYPKDEGHHETLGPHKKFTDYAFDPDEFHRLVRLGVAHVLQHTAYAEKYFLKDEL